MISCLFFALLSQRPKIHETWVLVMCFNASDCGIRWKKYIRPFLIIILGSRAVQTASAIRANRSRVIDPDAIKEPSYEARVVGNVTDNVLSDRFTALRKQIFASIQLETDRREAEKSAKCGPAPSNTLSSVAFHGTNVRRKVGTSFSIPSLAEQETSENQTNSRT